jgi:hypothetical protein
MESRNPQPSKFGNPSGGCSTGCAFFFVLIAVVWPLLHVIGGSYEPDVLFLPILLGMPAFFITHILAIVALRSQSAETRKWGKRALFVLWGGIAVFLGLGLIEAAIDSIFNVESP